MPSALASQNRLGAQTLYDCDYCASGLSEDTGSVIPRYAGRGLERSRRMRQPKKKF